MHIVKESCANDGEYTANKRCHVCKQSLEQVLVSFCMVFLLDPEFLQKALPDDVSLGVVHFHLQEGPFQSAVKKTNLLISSVFVIPLAGGLRLSNLALVRNIYIVLDTSPYHYPTMTTS